MNVFPGYDPMQKVDRIEKKKKGLKRYLNC